MKNNIIKTLILIFISLTFYYSRQIFFYKYEPEYYENWYYHSQWNIPNSVRGIGDGDLYKFVGYRLAFGENPFNINYEVPPFAKLLYGLAERFFSNPYIISIIFYLSSFIILHLISKIFFQKNTHTILLTLLLMATSPFISTQVRETMLDLPLMFFFLVHLLFFLKYLQLDNLQKLIFAGIFLGIATGCKIGVYSPLIFLIGLIFILTTKTKKIKKILLYAFSTLGGYGFSFISYFIYHPNPIPWLRLHEKPIRFYIGQGNSHIDYFNQLKGILINRYQGFWAGAQPGTLGDWSPMLTAGLLLLIVLLITSIKNKNKLTLYLCLFSLSFILINCFIPFFPRYLMPIIPTFCLIITICLQQKPFLIYLLIILNIPFYYTSVIKQPYQGTIESTTRFINTRNYRELYRSISLHQRNLMNEDYFINSYENFLNKIGTRSIESNITSIKFDQDIVTGVLNTTYQTRYGPLENKSNIIFQKINNQWKLNWDWNYLFNRYKPEYQINIVPKLNQIAAIEAFMAPRSMSDWGLNLTQIQDITKIPQQTINDRLRFSVPDKYYRWVGNVNIKNFDETRKIPGLEFFHYPQKAEISFIDNQNQKIYLFE
jgi:hypothetical protein